MTTLFYCLNLHLIFSISICYNHKRFLQSAAHQLVPSFSSAESYLVVILSIFLYELILREEGIQSTSYTNTFNAFYS